MCAEPRRGEQRQADLGIGRAGQGAEAVGAEHLDVVAVGAQQLAPPSRCVRTTPLICGRQASETMAMRNPVYSAASRAGA